MRIACLHTAAQNQITFDAVFRQADPDVSVVHEVRDDLLTQAQAAGFTAVLDPVMDTLRGLSDADAVLCTCSTLGPLIDTIQSPKFIRVDRPLMEAAAEYGPAPLIAFCLESTRASTLELFADVRGADADPVAVMCDGAWPYFLRGDMAGFAEVIAEAVLPVAEGRPAIVLAQASMAVAAPALADAGVPVLTAPELAVQRALAVAAG